MAITLPAKIYNLGELKNIKFSGTIVLCGGTFDLIHEGHVDHILEAASLGDNLIVHVTGDLRVKEKKGNDRPIISETSRAKIVSFFRGIDAVFIHNGRHYSQEVIEAIRPDIIYINAEGNIDQENTTMEMLKDFKGQIFISKMSKVASTSEIIKKIKST